MSKKQILFLSIVSSVLIVLVVGIAIPKLTVYDKVSVDKDFRNNVMQAFYFHSDNPIERIALWLGKSRIVSAMPLSAEVESFTLFRIPLGFLRGIPDMKVGIFFNPAGDWSARINSDTIGFSSKLFVPVPDEMPPGWYSHQVSDSHIILTKQQDLPDIGGTESYAYGDQINISVSEFDGDSTENWPHLVWIEDKALVKEKSWTEVSGMVALWVRHEAAGAGGEQITWYLFDEDDDKVYEFSLYMPQDKPNDETFGDFVRQYGTQFVRQGIESAFIEKYPNWDKPGHFSITIEEISSTYARGIVNWPDNDHNGFWFATKVDGRWVITDYGGGSYFGICQNFKQYDFPSEMIPDCWDSEQLILINTPNPEKYYNGLTVEDKEKIKQAFIEYKGDKDYQSRDLFVRFSEMEGNALKGSILIGGIDNYSTPYFLAIKTGESWKVLYQGQEAPPCESLEGYEVPVNLIPDCWADNGQEWVKRGDI